MICQYGCRLALTKVFSQICDTHIGWNASGFDFVCVSPVSMGQFHVHLPIFSHDLIGNQLFPTLGTAMMSRMNEPRVCFFPHRPHEAEERSEIGYTLNNCMFTILPVNIQPAFFIHHLLLWIPHPPCPPQYLPHVFAITQTVMCLVWSVLPSLVWWDGWRCVISIIVKCYCPLSLSLSPADHQRLVIITLKE